MRNRKSINTRVIQAVSILTALTFAPPVLAVCVQSYPPADTIVAIDANNGCADIKDQEGCSITKNLGEGTCTYEDSGGKWFTVNSSYNPDGSLSWKLDSESTITGIDTGTVSGGFKGNNNCGYIFKYDVAKGFGGDCKSYDTEGNCTSYQNITGLSVCTDGKDDIAPPLPQVAEKLPSCQQSDTNIPGGVQDTLGGLDDTGIVCPTYQIGDEIPVGLTAGDQKPVVVCNLEKDKEDWGATDGSDLCCQCGIPLEQQTACIVGEDRDQCAQSMTVNPTQSVQLNFFKDDLDPSTWIYTSKGWTLISY